MCPVPCIRRELPSISHLVLRQRLPHGIHSLLLGHRNGVWCLGVLSRRRWNFDTSCIFYYLFGLSKKIFDVMLLDCSLSLHFASQIDGLERF